MSIVKLQNVRLCFASIFEAKPVGATGTPRFSAAFPIEPGSPNAKLLVDALQAVAHEKWGAKSTAILAEIERKGDIALKKFPLSKDGVVYEGFEGQWSFNASSQTRPLVLDRDKTPLTAADGRPYNGCYVNVSVEIWAQDNSWGKKLNAQLRGVQFYSDGDAFAGGRAASQEEFDAIAEGAGAGDLV